MNQSVFRRAGVAQRRRHLFLLQQAVVRHRALIAAGAIVLATSGCASSGITRGAPSGPGSANTARQDSASEESWLQAGADGLALAQKKLRRALHSVYQSWAGTPYQYGGQTKDGVDCSSFVRQAIDTADAYELPRTTVEQARVGMSISKSNLQTGDLVFFKTGGLSHHVGIYMGSGRFMHASSSQGVTISRLDNIYWRHHYWQSRRIIADTDIAAGTSNL